ncbi:YagE family uncharacterized protein [Paenibacillus taihuensis]|uniref:YagE family uncharacterized protein n=1 Tax=Paenibacillus taihuensis TaxID=1156355 RepID=A0A3D9SGS6_9BACL|nr:RMD1 family protein [Paenibacillus taihuensis]REE88982.1 YagE family uncharacterized protein [Paenibacillus taihuensis]
MELKNISFRALAVTNEIDLNKIALHLGIPKKFTWEQPLILRSQELKSIYPTRINELQQVLVFSFGSVVFVNHHGKGEINMFLKFLQSFERDIDLSRAENFTDDYNLHIGDIENLELTDEYVVVSEYEFFFPELISTVLAKSVALEKAEQQLSLIQDSLEVMIERLEKGKLRIGNKELARTTAKIVRHEFNTLAYIMILDKPEVTWTHQSASQFYDQMMNFFELNDRYTILKSKTDILYHITEGFSDISHSIRGLFVEWIVVILIVIEVVITLLQIVGWVPTHA